MKLRFGAGHALKSPAHITLQMPFRREEGKEKAMMESLKNFAEEESEFQVELKGFDCFAPRVIFVKISDHKPLQALHSRFKKMLRNEIGMKDRNTFDFHPHMTIATRDLTEEAFHNAWPDFESRKFEGSFKVKSLFLLKHNGKFWEIYQEFPFGK